MTTISRSIVPVLSLFTLTALVALAPGRAQAQPAAHYVPGLEGIKGGTLPPPGVYLRDYNLFYFANQMNDFSGNKVPNLDPEVFVYANAPRLIWITELEVLGGYIGVDGLVPLKYTDIGAMDDSVFGIGDAFAEVTWSRHWDRLDVGLGYGVWMPTGDSDPAPMSAEPGQGYWTHMFTAGLTYHLGSEKQFSLSALNRYEISTEKKDTDWTPGQAWTVECAVSYALRPTIDLGLVGYYQLQTTESTGADDRSQVLGVGPEISAVCTKLGVNTSLRYVYEVLAEGRLQGHTIMLTLTKRF